MQLISFTTTKSTLSVTLMKLSPLIMTSCAFIKYSTFWYKIDAVKEFMEQVKYDWKVNRNECSEILRKHASSGRYYSNIFASLIYPTVLIPILCYMLNVVQNVFLPIKDTRMDKTPTIMDYFFDEQTHSHLLTFLQCFAFFINTTIVIGIETLTVMWLEHVSSLFIIVSYYIEKAVVENSSKTPVTRRSLSNNCKKNLVKAVVVHRKAILLVSPLNVSTI
ncbi:hypothetical protein ANTRET_LOCUS7258 [Anthophora retusa]